MNISDYLQPAMYELVSQKESAIMDALIEFWGVCSLEQIKQRCQLVRLAGSPVETLVADGVPLLEIHPVEFTEPRLEGDKYVSHATQKFRRLRVAEDKVDAVSLR